MVGKNAGEERMPCRGDLNAAGTHYWDGPVWEWQPLWLSAAEAGEAARAVFGTDVGEVSFLADGYLNQSWRIDTGPAGFVLRVGRPEVTEEQTGYEHDFATVLHAQVPEAVAPLSGRDGRTVQRWRSHVLSLFPFVEGTAGTEVPAEVRSGEVAGVKARFHQAASARFPRRQRPGFRSVDEHPRWVWTRIRPVLTAELQGDDRFEELAAAFDQEAADLDAWLDHLHHTGRPLPRAAIHGDLNPRNLLFREDRLVGVIDFDGCRVEPLAWEVAQTAVGEPDIDPQVFWRQYLDAGGPLDPGDIDLLGGFARIGCFSQLQWAVNETGVRPSVLELLEDVASGLAYLRTREQELRG